MSSLRTYTPEEVVAEFLPTMTPGGLRKAAQRRRVPHHRIGRNRQIVFTQADIELLLERSAVAPVDEAAPEMASAPRGGGGGGGRKTAATPPPQSGGLTARPGGPRRLRAI